MTCACGCDRPVWGTRRYALACAERMKDARRRDRNAARNARRNAERCLQRAYPGDISAAKIDQIVTMTKACQRYERNREAA